MLFSFLNYLDVYIDVPDIIDITRMRSKGIQSGEELLPEKGWLTISVGSFDS